MSEAFDKKLLPAGEGIRILADFTGHSYRLIMESNWKTLSDYEQSLQSEMAQAEWQQWYQQFKSHVESSHREILKQVTFGE